MIERIYVEIGNICNLSCSFCPKTKRAKKQMSPPEFRTVIERIKNETKFVYLHVMGEPLLHPQLAELFEILRENKMRANITTNGTLLHEKSELLLSFCDVVHKISVSLHSLEGNGRADIMTEYVENISEFAKKASEKGIFTVMRLWNEDSAEGVGKNAANPEILKLLKDNFSGEWQSRRAGFRIMKNTFLEYDGIFTWPIESTAEEKMSGRCHGLKDQVAILADGSVVPCCLDSEGVITLGNIFESELSEILSTPRAIAMKKGFEKGELIEELCRKCTYSDRFSHS